jgi:hypothetical protein
LPQYNIKLESLMKKSILAALLVTLSLSASDSLESWFEEGSLKGNIKYYYIETKKEQSDGSHSSAHANALGGTLNYTTGSWGGLKAGVTFMTTQGFALPSAVDSSVLGRNNGVRENDPQIAKDSFSVLGEASLSYSNEGFKTLYGRQVIQTPLVHAKEVRMLPSAVQGAFVEYRPDSSAITLGTSYLTHFKQRTSDTFTNMTKHALGENTQAITGSDEGEVLVANALYKGTKTEINLYDYYAEDFINALYFDAGFKNRLNSDWSYSAAAQYIHQTSIGTADERLADNASLTGGKRIGANAFGLKSAVMYKESSFALAFTKVLADDDRHDALVLPWDGTPLYTNMITSNNLFQSNYGKALSADSVYIGGSAGIKAAFTQAYDFSGIKGFKSILSYLYIDNERFADNQRDINAVISYALGNFTLDLKGMWVRHNTSASADGIITQDKRLSQYRVIANYKF